MMVFTPARSLGESFSAASDALADFAEIVPGVPIVRLQLDRPFHTEVGGLDFVALFEPLSEGVEFRRRKFLDTLRDAIALDQKSSL